MQSVEYILTFFSFAAQCLQENSSCRPTFVSPPAPPALAAQLSQLLIRRWYLKTIGSRRYVADLAAGNIAPLPEVPYPWRALGETPPTNETTPTTKVQFSIAWYHTVRSKYKRGES